jgi:hypothetical protein
MPRLQRRKSSARSTSELDRRGQAFACCRTPTRDPLRIAKKPRKRKRDDRHHFARKCREALANQIIVQPDVDYLRRTPLVGRAIERVRSKLFGHRLLMSTLARPLASELFHRPLCAVRAASQQPPSCLTSHRNSLSHPTYRGVIIGEPTDRARH